MLSKRARRTAFGTLVVIAGISFAVALLTYYYFFYFSAAPTHPDPTHGLTYKLSMHGSVIYVTKTGYLCTNGLFVFSGVTGLLGAILQRVWRIPQYDDIRNKRDIGS